MYCVRLVTENKKDYLPLLLEADPSEEMIDLYLGRGALYVMEDEGREVAEAVVTMECDGLCELKNIAVKEEERRKGYGTLLLQNLFFQYARAFTQMKVGTCKQILPFYEKLGFTKTGEILGFFTENYPAPIYENGELVEDMILLSRPLTQGCTCCAGHGEK